MNKDKPIIERITDKIIACAFEVNKILGYGFNDKVYERALIYELSRQGLSFESQYPLNVYYKGIIVGEFFTDILVENLILVEVEAIETLTDNNENKCLNYLKSSEFNVCLLLNFGKLELEIKHII
jgi:GxxExxY protein